MSWYSRSLRQTATYWPPPVKNEWGDQTYPSPATMRCHWKEEAQKFVSPAGAEYTSKAIVHVEDDIEPDGFLHLGAVSAANPRTVTGADRIQQVEKLPTLRLDVVVYVAYL